VGAFALKDPTIGIDRPLDGLTPTLATKDAAAPPLSEATPF
jgi:dTDP-4-dehydrorhamnose 3,5-epimerase-like enzyme